MIYSQLHSYKSTCCIIFFSLSASTKTFSPIISGSLSFLRFLSLFWYRCVCIFQHKFELYLIYKNKVSRDFWFFYVFSSTKLGETLYFWDAMPFKLLVVRWISFFVSILLVEDDLCILLLFWSIFLNSLIFCSAANAFPPLVLVWNIKKLYLWLNF